MLEVSKRLFGLSEKQTQNILVPCGLSRKGNIAVLMIETVKKRSYAKVGEHSDYSKAIAKAVSCNVTCYDGHQDLLFRGVLYDSEMNIYTAQEVCDKAA
jgi:hypothetical protein